MRFLLERRLLLMPSSCVWWRGATAGACWRLLFYASVRDSVGPEGSLCLVFVMCALLARAIAGHAKILQLLTPGWVGASAEPEAIGDTQRV